MIFKLIKIELLKVFRKKGIYVIWGVMLLFCFFNNFLYWRDYDSEGRYLYEKKENIQEEIKNLTKEKDSAVLGTDARIMLETKIELLKLKSTFSPNSWQYFKVNDYLYDALYERNKDSTNLEKAKYSDDLILKFKNNDYSYFWDLEKKDLESQISFLKEAQENDEGDTNLQENLEQKEEDLSVLNYRIKNRIVEDNGYLNEALSTYLSSRDKLKNLSKNTDEEKTVYQEVKREMKISETVLLDRVNYQAENTLTALLKGIMDDYEFFFVIIILMVSATLICDEFQKGTVKFLLIKPVSRFIILLSKYFTSILVLLMSVLLVFSFQFVLGGIFFGFDTLRLGVIVYDYEIDKVLHFNVFLYFVLYLLAKMPCFLMISLISLLIGVLTASTIISILIPLMLSVFSSSMLELAISHRLYWMKYFPNFIWRFSSYLFGKSSGLEGLDFWFSCIWYSLYFVTFLLLIRGIFKRKDIKNV